MDEGSCTLAKATVTSDHTATHTVALATTHPLPPGHPTNPHAEELVPGVPRALHDPASVPPAARQCWREDVLLHDGPQDPCHQARYALGLQVGASRVNLEP
jgi:hypothetical protein